METNDTPPTATPQCPIHLSANAVPVETGAAPSVSAPRFSDVQAILNALVKGHDPDDMRAAHSCDTFGWDTLDQLKGVVVYPEGTGGQGYPLIDQSLVDSKQGEQTNLVIALSQPGGVDGYGQMPRTPPGRRATSAEIQTIIDWLNSGMPE